MAGEIQVTIVLDSGLFLTDEKANGYTYSEVGYFTPHAMIYADGEKKDELDPLKFGTDGYRINVRKIGKDGDEIVKNIVFSDCLLEYLSRLHNVYGHVVHVDTSSLDCIFHFNSGRFCSSKVKPRNFREYNGLTHAPTGNKKSIGAIAHDIVVHHRLAKGEKLIFALAQEADKEIWSSEKLNAKNRIDIEILADNSTAEMFYCQGLKLRGQNYWLPNQGGDPPPTWIHGGHGGSGG
jgi:hypothetical protein